MRTWIYYVQNQRMCNDFTEKIFMPNYIIILYNLFFKIGIVVLKNTLLINSSAIFLIIINFGFIISENVIVLFLGPIKQILYVHFWYLRFIWWFNIAGANKQFHCRSVSLVTGQ